MSLRKCSFLSRRIARAVVALAALYLTTPLIAQDQPDKVFKIFQFPPNKIPQIDGNADDWAIVPDSYTISTDQLHDDRGNHTRPDPKNLDVHVKVGWVKGLNRLYFLYEAYDNFWDFESTNMHNDTFELVVDGDLSGGPLLPQFRLNPAQNESDAYFSIGGVMAQNYHIFTPAVGKDWALTPGCEPWTKELPYANHAASYHFKQGESGKYVMEFWITPFDYAGCEGPQRAVESKLEENKVIGISWAVIDYDGPAVKSDGFWNLSSQHNMFGNASMLRAFRLMPLESQFKTNGIQAKWSFKILDMSRRLVAFHDLSEGGATSWKWDFGDGTSSTEQHPLHSYKDAGSYIVVLYVKGPTGKSRMSKIYDVVVR